MTMTEDDSMQDILQPLIAEGTRAVIFSNISFPDQEKMAGILRSRKIPAVSIDSFIPGMDNIRLDRSVGTCQAAKMLLLSGCRHPVFYSSSSIDQPDSRLEGIIRAYKEFGRKEKDICLIQVRSHVPASGSELATQVLNSMPVDGIFCYDDYLAVATMRKLYQEGIKVPEEIRIIGFDNIPIAAMLPISLTTVAQPVEEVAKAALNAVVHREQDFEAPYIEEFFPTHLVVRESAPITRHSLREEIFRT